MKPSPRLTCGAGLAANADLPAKLAQLTAAQADLLERHTHALDPAAPAARQELDAYHSLVRGFRTAASHLDALAKEMAGYANLPPAPHDMAVMTDPNGQSAALRTLTARQRELAELLHTKTAQPQTAPD